MSDHPDLSSKRVDEFIKKYNEFWADLGKSIDSEMWWSLVVSSRDRHLCVANRLFEQIFQKHSTELDLKRGNLLFSLVKVIVYSILMSFQILWVKLVYCLRGKRVLIADQGQLVFRTYAYERSFDKSKEEFRDPFWASLDEESNRGKIKIVIPLGCFRTALAYTSNPSRKAFLVQNFGSVLDPWQALMKAAMSYFKFPEKELHFEEVEVSSYLHSLWKSEVFSISTLMAFTQYLAIKRVTRSLKPKKFFLSYEGLVWDKMAIRGVRSESLSVKIVGYQHTVVPTSALNYFLEETALDPVPDVLFTTGVQPARVIKKYNKKISEIREGVAFRYRNFSQGFAFKRSNKRRVLLALEGLLQVEPMIRYAIDQLGNSDWQVCIRAHPILPWQVLTSKLGLPVLPENFCVSENHSLSADLGSSFCVVYWGSTTALEALQYGLPVIHFDAGSILSYDPLDGLNYGHRAVTESGSLISVLEELYSHSEEELNDEIRKGQQKLTEYFSEVTPDKVEEFLNV